MIKEQNNRRRVQSTSLCLKIPPASHSVCCSRIRHFLVTQRHSPSLICIEGGRQRGCLLLERESSYRHQANSLAHARKPAASLLLADRLPCSQTCTATTGHQTSTNSHRRTSCPRCWAWCRRRGGHPVTCCRNGDAAQGNAIRQRGGKVVIKPCDGTGREAPARQELAKE